MLGLLYMGGIAVQNLDELSIRKPAGLVLQTAGFLAVVFAGVSGGATTLITAALIMTALRYMWRVEASLIVGGIAGVMVQAFSTRHIGEVPALAVTAVGIGAMFVGMVMMPSKLIAAPIARTTAVLTSSVKAMRSTGWAFSRGTKTEKPARFSILIAAMKNPLPMVKAAKAAKPAKPAKAAKAAKPAKAKAAKPTKSTSSGSDADSSILTRIEALTKPTPADDIIAEEVLEEEVLEVTAAAVVEDSVEADDSVEAETKIQDDEIIAELERMLKGEI
jgi:hypothetical protein